MYVRNLKCQRSVYALILLKLERTLKKPGLEVIKLDYSLRLESTMIGCLRTRVRKQPIIELYFESENELKFCNLEASSQGGYKNHAQLN